MFRFFAALCFLTALYAQQPGRGGAAQAPARIPTIEERTAGMQKLDGFFPVYWEERTGYLYLEIPRFDTPVLYTTGLAAGLGSNDIGLDRGQEGGGKIVSFERVGPRVLMVQGNENFRSSSANPAERRSVEDSFAKSVLWGFTVAAETNGRVLVDATDFFVRDGHGAGGSLGPAAAYRVDRTRSAVYLPRTKAFPKNTEIEVTLTFTNETGGGRGGGAADPTRDRLRSSSPIRQRCRVHRPADAAGGAADSSPAPSPASLPPPKPSPSANTIRWSNCPTAITSRATTIRAPVTAAWPMSTTARPSANRW